MNLLEIYPELLAGLQSLKFETEYQTGKGDTPYSTSNLKALRNTIDKVSDITYIQKEIKQLKESWLYGTSLDKLSVSSTDSSLVERILEVIKNKLSVLKEIADSKNFGDREDILFIKFPEIVSFDDLSKISSDLKKSIEIPILHESLGKVEIVAADNGSIIFYIGVGTLIAVKLVAAICWAAAVIRKKRAEAKIFEAHAKTLDLKNDSLANLIDAQQIQLRNILNAEAEAIASKTYNLSDPETIERLKLSINTTADLIERGAKILPVSNEQDIQLSFPDYSKLNLIESSIKQLQDGK